MNDTEMRLIFLQTSIESLDSTHDIIPGICGKVLKYGVKYRGMRRPRAYCPALFYPHTWQQTAVYTLKT